MGLGSIRPGRLLVAVAVPLAVALGACGGGDDEQIEAAIVRVSTSTDPSYCEESVTAAYLVQRSGLADEDDALSDCLARAEDSRGLPESVDVTAIAVSGDTARAMVLHRGGAYDGSTMELELVDDDGWRVDSVASIENVDIAGYEAFMVDGLLAEPYNWNARSAKCLAGRFVGDSDAEFLAGVISFDNAEYARVAVGCDRGGVERISLASYRDQYGATVAECVERELATMNDEELAGLYAEPASQRLLAADCGG